MAETKYVNVIFGRTECEVCMEADVGAAAVSARTPPATVYCVDCQQNLCAYCSRSHRAARTGAHQLRPVGFKRIAGQSFATHFAESVNTSLNEKLRLKFRAVHLELVKFDLLPIADDLFTNFVITSDNYKDVCDKKNPKQRAQKLLSILHTSKHPQAFLRLRSAMENDADLQSLVKLLDHVQINNEAVETYKELKQGVVNPRFQVPTSVTPPLRNDSEPHYLTLISDPAEQSATAAVYDALEKIGETIEIPSPERLWPSNQEYDEINPQTTTNFNSSSQSARSPQPLFSCPPVSGSPNAFSRNKPQFRNENTAGSNELVSGMTANDELHYLTLLPDPVDQSATEAVCDDAVGKTMPAKRFSSTPSGQEYDKFNPQTELKVTSTSQSTLCLHPSFSWPPFSGNQPQFRKNNAGSSEALSNPEEVALPGTQMKFVTESGDPVYGLALLRDRLYVLRQRQKVTIDMFNCEDHTLIRSRTMQKLPKLKAYLRDCAARWDMIACDRASCLFVAEQNAMCIHKIKRDLNNLKESWIDSSVLGDYPCGLSLANDNDELCLLVTFSYSCKLIKLNSKGSRAVVIRRIPLESLTAHVSCTAHHAVQIGSGRYAVCRGGGWSGPQNVFVVDNCGNVLCSYGVTRGSQNGKLDEPCHLAADENNCAYVADKWNARVVFLSPTLDFISYVIDGMSSYPVRLCFDQRNKHLYVGQQNGAVTVADI